MNKSIIITVLCILLSEITRTPLYSSSIKIIRKRLSTVLFAGDILGQMHISHWYPSASGAIPEPKLHWLKNCGGIIFDQLPINNKVEDGNYREVNDSL